jgi:hypothetical protein
MQSKFTQKNLGHYKNKVAALALILFLSAYSALAQEGRFSENQRVQEKFKNYELRQKASANSKVDNDAGMSRKATSPAINRTEAICQTFNGDFIGAPTMSNRLFRPGATSSCTVPYTFPGTFAQTVPYRTFTYTNTTGLTQCGTFTLSTTGAGSNAQFAIYNGSFNPASLATNYLADPGVSGVGNPTSCQGTINSGQTIVFAVFDLGTPASSFTLTVDFPICASAPCAGTPNPGNTLTSLPGPTPTVCSGISFTLSLQNATTGSGVSYQWQTAPSATGPWTNAGPNSASWSTSQTVATCYRCIVTCSSPGGGSGTSTPVCVALTPPSGCYCIPGASDCTDDDVITRVRISTLDNPSGCSTGPPPGYGNFTSLPAPIVYAGAPNPIIVDKRTIWAEGVSVWIDYNQNGTFEASEQTSLGVVPAATAQLTGNINIPSTALTGPTRMRIRMQFNAVPGNPCNAYTFGETEDYTVNIQPCVPITITGSPANVTTTCGGNATFTVTTSGSLPAYAWEFRTSPTGFWQNVPNAAPYSNINTATLTLTNIPASFNGYQYRAIVSGGCSALDFSNTATLTVNPIVPVVNPSSASICIGSVQQLSLTNTLGNADLISEGFNTVIPTGWTVINRSSPLGTTSWFQGNPAVFPSQSGAPNAYAAANFQSTGSVGQISTWMITPSVAIKNGDQLRFWTRKIAPDAFPDRMQVRMSQVASTNVGATATSVGDFTTLLLDINPTEITGVYPVAWTQYTITISGLAGPVTGNFAFRYFVSNAGSAAPNSDFIGVDEVRFTSVGGTAQGTWSGPAGTMWTNAGATIPYTGGLASTIYVTPTVNSNYSVFFTTLTPCTSATTTVPISVFTPATLTSPPANRAVCVGNNATFSVTATGGPLTYQWQVSVDGGVSYSNISGATSSTLTLNAVTLAMHNNLYRCVISAGPCAGAVTTAPGRLTVNALPVVTISASTLQVVPGGVATFTATSTPAALNATSYSWTLNGSTIAGATGNTVTGNVDGLGQYQATVTDVNGCVNTSNLLTLTAGASDKLWIYPNPNTGQFQVRLYYNGMQAERRIVKIYTMGGQLINQKEFDLVSLTAPYLRMDFDLSRMPASTYVVKVVDYNEKEITSGLVVVQ